MAIEKTLSIIKPDAVKRSLMGEIIKKIEETTTINNINIINSSLEDAFLKLTNK